MRALWVYWRQSRKHFAVLRLPLAAVIGSVALVAGVFPATASAALNRPAITCTDSWTNASGGSWSDHLNWSSGSVPGSGDDACVTLAGTYTVHLQASPTSPHTVTIGAASGTQTLALESTCNNHAVFGTVAGVTINSNGALTLTNGDACANNATLTSSVVNNGTLSSLAPVGGARTLQGNVTNNGTIQVSTGLIYNGATTLLTNNGTIGVADGVTLSVSSGASVTNAATGSITGNGTTHTGLLSEVTGIFTEAGTTSGAEPLIVDDVTLAYTGGGASTIHLRGSNSVSGSLVAGQTLIVESTCGEHAVATWATSFTNAGSLTMTNGDACGNNSSIVVTSGTFTNQTTLTIAAPIGGARTLAANVTNTGTIAVNQTTTYSTNGTTFDNKSAVNIATGTALNVTSGASFNNETGASITATGTGAYNQTSGTFTQSGTTAGTVVLDDLTFNNAGTGSTTIHLRGSDSVSGSLAAGQTLILESTCGEHAVAIWATSFTNAGSLTMTNGDACGNNSTISVTSGTFTNQTTLTIAAANGGARTLTANVTNTGTIAVNQTTTYSTSGTTFDNKGALNIATGTALNITSGASFNSDTGGSLTAAGTGVLNQSSGTFTQGLGKASGKRPIVLDNTTLAYTGTGKSAIVVRGTTGLSGSIAAGQSMTLESTCGEHAVVVTGAALSDAGSITMTNGDVCGNNATITVGGTGVLTNSGTLQVLTPAGGTRQINGSYVQTSKGKLAIGFKSASVFAHLVVSGSASLAGTLTLVKPFKGSAGQQFNVLTASTVTGTFAHETGDQIKSTGLYYLPTYATGGVTLVITQATMSLGATTVARGASLTVSGTSYPPNDTITITLTDSLGHVSTFSTGTDSAGAFNTSITVPLSDATGTAKVKAASGLTGVAITKTVTVT